jgi:hypothetical protein
MALIYARWAGVELFSWLWRAGQPPNPRSAAMVAQRRFLHDDEARPLEVAHNALCGDGGHVLIGLVNGLPTLEAQGEGDGVGQVTRLGGRKLFVCVGHTADDNAPMRT